ncbi:hypothetical protein J7K18_06985 [bacterium]|nr:hypothetical protein [bacterium]
MKRIVLVLLLLLFPCVSFSADVLFWGEPRCAAHLGDDIAVGFPQGMVLMRPVVDSVVFVDTLFVPGGFDELFSSGRYLYGVSRYGGVYIFERGKPLFSARCVHIPGIVASAFDGKRVYIAVGDSVLSLGFDREGIPHFSLVSRTGKRICAMDVERGKAGFLFDDSTAALVALKKPERVLFSYSGEVQAISVYKGKLFFLDNRGFLFAGGKGDVRPELVREGVVALGGLFFAHGKTVFSLDGTDSAAVSHPVCSIHPVGKDIIAVFGRGSFSLLRISSGIEPIFSYASFASAASFSYVADTLFVLDKSGRIYAISGDSSSFVLDCSHWGHPAEFAAAGSFFFLRVGGNSIVAYNRLEGVSSDIHWSGVKHISAFKDMLVIAAYELFFLRIKTCPPYDFCIKGRFPLVGEPCCLVSSGDGFVVVDKTGWLYLFLDVSDSVRLAKRLGGYNPAGSVAAVGGRVFLAERYGRVVVLDEELSEVTTLPVSGEIVALAVRGRWLAVAVRNGGVLVYRLDEGSNCRAVSSFDWLPGTVSLAIVGDCLHILASGSVVRFCLSD